jgi:hypothetical protein
MGVAERRGRTGMGRGLESVVRNARRSCDDGIYIVDIVDLDVVLIGDSVGGKLKGFLSIG